MEVAAVAAGSLVGLVGALCILALGRFLYLRFRRLRQRAVEEDGSSHSLPSALRTERTEAAPRREAYPPPSPSMARSNSISSDEGGDDTALPGSTVRRLSSNLASPREGRSPKVTVLAFLSESSKSKFKGGSKKEPPVDSKAVEADIEVLTLE